MVKDMIAKLEADAFAEQNQKGWCDEAMAGAMSKRDDNTAEVEGDTATITKSEAKAAKLQEEITELANEVAELEKGLSEATQLRANERAENEKTKADATMGEAGVTRAQTILKEFYENAFLQTRTKYTPPKAAADGETVEDKAPAMDNAEYS